MRGCCLLLTIAVTGALTGCGGAKPPDRFQIKIAEDGQGYNLATAAYLPPLEQGRIEVAAPKGWRSLPRSSNFVAGFYLNNLNGLPQIQVKTESSPYEGFTSITKENVVAFARLLDKQLAEQKAAVIEPPKPMVIGGVPCVRYVLDIRIATFVSGARVSNDAERQVLETIHDGRLYRVELSVLDGTILEYRDAGYAVLASLKFHDQPAAAATPEKPAAKPEDEKPAKKNAGKKGAGKKSGSKKNGGAKKNDANK